MTTPGTYGVMLVLANVLMLFGPGAIVCVAARLPWWSALAAAPLVTYGLIAILAPVVSGFGWAWSPVWLGVVTLVGVLVVLAVRLAASLLDARRGEPASAHAPSPGAALRSRWRGDLAIAGSVGGATLIGALAGVRAMGGPHRVNQHWDWIFHANAVRFISETGDADPSALAALNDYEAASFFYPNTYHVLAASVGQLTEATVPETLNSQFLLLAGVTGLGLAVLVRRYGAGIGLAVSVPITLAAISAFPYDLLDWGPLLPYATGLALVPAFLVVLTDLIRDRSPAVFLIVACGAVGLLGVHPGAAFTALVFAAAMFAYRWRRQPGLIKADALVLGLVGVLAVALGSRYVLGALTARTSAIGDWPVVGTPGAMLGQLLTLNIGKEYPQYWLVLLMILGLIGLRQLRELYWVLAAGVVFCVLFVMAASYEGTVVGVLTGPWWNDRWRLAAVVGVAMAVLAAHGVVTAAELLTVGFRRIARRSEAPRHSFAVAVLAVLLLFGLVSQGFYIDANAERMSVAYVQTRTVSAAEDEAMQVLAEMVQPGERVMNDPLDGSAMMYALYNITPMFGHVVAPESIPDMGPDQQQLLGSFNCLDSDPEIQELVRRYDIGYVFLGNDFVQARFERVNGLRDLMAVDSVTRVYDEDGVSIYTVELPATSSGRPGNDSCSSSG
ncbi:MAG: hypothetical protein H0V64_14760, partial [Geodermatophilaceae bacterium]|nr:hypothetical protein [Geodermatophilaceae bacterium]